MSFKHLSAAAIFLFFTAVLCVPAQETDSPNAGSLNGDSGEESVPSQDQSSDEESSDEESSEEESSEEEASDDQSSEEEASEGLSLNMGIGLGATTIDGKTWQVLSVYPDLAVGKLGIGLGINFRYQLIVSSSGHSKLAPREEDWVVKHGSYADWLNLYLTKVEYVRWAQKGDPLYIKAGNITGAVLGTGFTLNGYRNTLFLPDRRLFGAAVDVDGRLVGFPYLGFESVAGNVSRFDVIGGRVYLRPLAWLDVPVIKGFQVGGSGYMDREPFLYLQDDKDDGDSLYDGTMIPSEAREKPIIIKGADTILPVFDNRFIGLRLFTDTVVQPKNSTGFMGGFDGNLFGFLLYGGQYRRMSTNFIPGYFGPAYDTHRGRYYPGAKSDEILITASQGYQGMAGLSFFEGGFITQVTVDGPRYASSDDAPRYRYPHLNGQMVLAEDVIPAFFFDAHYDKYAIDSWEAFRSYKDALIGATVNYKNGPAVISMTVDVQYNPEYETNPDEYDKWDVSTKLETRISF